MLQVLASSVAVVARQLGPYGRRVSAADYELSHLSNC